MSLSSDGIPLLCWVGLALATSSGVLIISSCIVAIVFYENYDRRSRPHAKRAYELELQVASGRVAALSGRGAIKNVRPPPLGRRKTDHAQRLRNGTATMGVLNLIKIGIHIIYLPVIAHLVSPSDFGLFALALPTIVFVQMLADGGLGSSLARENPSARLVWSTAFWMVQFICLFLAAAVIIWSYLLSILVNQHSLPPIICALSITVLSLGLSVLPSARLLQQGRVGVGAAADFGTDVAGTMLAIGLAMIGAGVWSLVAQVVFASVLKAIILNVAAPVVPQFRFRPQAVLPHLRFGGTLVGIRLADLVGRLGENSLVARFGGGTLLGAYTLGNQGVRVISEAASNPLWTRLYVQALHRDQEFVVEEYERLTRLMSFLLFPISFLAAPFASQWIGLLLGHQWQGTGFLVTILLPTYAMSVTASLSNAILFARGNAGVQLVLSSFFAAARVGATLLLPIFGLWGMTVALGAVNMAAVIGAIWLSVSVIKIPFGRIFRSLWAPTVASTVAMQTMVIFAAGRGPLSPFGLALTELAGLTFYLVLMAGFEPLWMAALVKNIACWGGREGRQT